MGAAVKKRFSVSKGIVQGAEKVVEYGPGGVGKTELATLISQYVTGEVVVIDIENGSSAFDVKRIGGKDEPIETWRELRSILQDEALLEPYGAVVIDSLTKAEELAVADALEYIPHPDKGNKVDNIEGYGFGKGYSYVYDTFLPLLGDLDALQRRGKWVICIAHDCVATVPNPAGEDWQQYQPRLQSPTSGKSSIRLRVKEWADHLLFVGYDVTVGKDGKGKGYGTRTIYPNETPTQMAKSRTLDQVVPYQRGSADLWNLLLNKGE